jgi:hypothetical protein
VTLNTAATSAAALAWHADTSAVPASVSLEYGTHFLLSGALLPGRREGGIIYLGDFFRTTAADPYAGFDVHGKWLLVHAPRTDLRTREDLARAAEDVARGVDARRRGALGFLFVPTALRTANWEEARMRTPTYRDLDPAHGAAYSQFPLPQVTLTREAVQRLVPPTLSVDTLFAAESTQAYGPAVDLGARHTFRLDTRGTEQSVRPYNVVGIIEGSDPQLREEYITVSSHLDGAVGRGANTAGDSIFNAADDNASGSAGNIALARALMSGPRPLRSIILIWDSGEEVGLWGSRFMAHSAIVPGIIAHFNIDMIGRTRQPGSTLLGEDGLSGPDTVFVVGPHVLSTHMDSIAVSVSRDANYITFDHRFDRAEDSFFYPRTNSAPYLERGIPYIDFFTGLHGDYHRQTDEAQKLDPKKMEAVMRAVFATLWLLADDPIRPRLDKPWPAHVPLIR